ncbi:transglutaminase family protein [Cellulomonas sp. P24]|uniref:transglutaminase family protein n=1 Tax=Cellulomonas sp. P24 TaxID=2885206 RepID=UPI00216AE972|nr:transglutaminase family protein [Cellulomonas sp. P24]MCR6494080.1 transglutaminase family protein [Cellulomonas sp. P24]
MRRLSVVHTTTFRYAGEVTASFNEARLTPVSDHGQTVLAATLDVAPCTWRHDYRDYWGSAVTAFEVSVPHDTLTITSSSRVEVHPPRAAVADVGWEDLRSPQVTDRMAELLADTPTTAAPADVVALAAEAARGLAPARAAEAICLLLRDELEYVPGVTAVHTPAVEAWDARTGVCQDMAHLALGALRSVGIPARYVSGYLHPMRGAETGQTVTGESHAWVEWWAGQWTGFDPTNRAPAGEHHVVLARGREYQDVAPLRGIYAGTSTDVLDVQVHITQEA